MASGLVDAAFRIYEWMILARILLSWIHPDPYHPVIRFLYRATEPVLAPFRRLLPSVGGIDFSPILVFLVLGFVRAAVVGALRDSGL